MLVSNSDSIGWWKKDFSSSLLISSPTISYLLDSILHPKPLAEAVPVWSANYSLSELPQGVCMDLYMCVCRCQQMQAGGRHTLGRKEAAVDWASMQGTGGNEDKLPLCCIDDSVCVCVTACVCMCRRQTDRQIDGPTDSSPVVVSQRWIPGPSDTSSCLDIRPLRTHTAGDGTKLAPFLGTHIIVSSIRSHLSAWLVTHSPFHVWPASHGHMKDLTPAVRSTQRSICVYARVCVNMYVRVCMCACSCQFSLSQTSFFWHHLVISVKLPYPENDFDTRKNATNQFKTAAASLSWGWVNCHKAERQKS